MAKLTKAQVTTLALIADGKVLYRRCGTAAWRIFGSAPGVVGRLVALGLATNDWPSGGDAISYRITPAGRAALEAANKEGGER